MTNSDPFQNGVDLIEYTYSFMQYNDNCKINADCNEIYIINQSVGVLAINNSLVLQPPAQAGVGKILSAGNEYRGHGNRYEIDRSQYELRFEVNDIKNGTARAVVIRKIYKYPDKEAKQLRKNG